MRILLVAVGTRLPAWAVEAYDGYVKRLPPSITLTLSAIPSPSRRGDAARMLRQESDAMLQRLQKHRGPVIALDERGSMWSSMALSKRMDGWMRDGEPIALLIGGADGLSDACRERAHSIWSLSRLTLPHALARVVVAEQLYRASAILAGHPYHRE